MPFATAPSIKDEAALKLIVEFSGAGASDTVLDVACGPGLVVCAFARVVRHATGIDITPAMLDRARSTATQQGLTNVTWRQGDVLPLPWPDASFSIVTSRFAFHHFLEPGAVLREMARVCRAGRYRDGGRQRARARQGRRLQSHGGRPRSLARAGAATGRAPGAVPAARVCPSHG